MTRYERQLARSIDPGNGRELFRQMRQALLGSGHERQDFTAPPLYLGEAQDHP